MVFGCDWNLRQPRGPGLSVHQRRPSDHWLAGRWEPAGILPEQRVEALPPLLHDVVARMEDREIFDEQTRPDSCIVNFYDEGDCIPPHIDHHDFARPFVTLSLLSEQSILFGREIRALGDGRFEAARRSVVDAHPNLSTRGSSHSSL